MWINKGKTMFKRMVLAVLITGTVAGAAASTAEATTWTGPWRCYDTPTRGGCNALQYKKSTTATAGRCTMSVRFGYWGAAGVVNVSGWTVAYTDSCSRISV